MFAQAFNSFNEQSKAFVEPILEFNRLALNQAQKLGEKQLELVNEYSKIGLSQLEKASKIQSIDDLKAVTEEQLKSSAEFSEKVMKDAQSMMTVSQEMATEWKDFVEKKLGTFSVVPKTESVKTAKK